MTQRTSASRAQLTLRVDLVSTDPSPWRMLRFDPELGLASLAEAIILAFGWTGTGTWRFGTTHTPWWGRDADAWGCGILTPARPASYRSRGYGDEHGYGAGGYGSGAYGSGGYGSGGYGADQYASDGYGSERYASDGYGADRHASDGYGADRYGETLHRCDREWSVDRVFERLGGELEFEYRQLDLDSARDDGPVWRHRIVASGIDEASSDPWAPAAMLLGGTGTVPRLGTESAYGELGDPVWRAAMAHEFELRFGPARLSSTGRGSGWAGLDAAIAGSSDAARRALRMDLVELGALDDVGLEASEVERATAPIRDLLRSAAHPDGIDGGSTGPLGDDLRALRLARVQKGVLRTLVSVRDSIMEDPAALWHELAVRLVREGNSAAYGRAAHAAERAVDLVCGDRDVRRFAFDEGHRRAWHTRNSGHDGPSRVDRILATLGLIGGDGRSIHPHARAFGIAMLRG